MFLAELSHKKKRIRENKEKGIEEEADLFAQGSDNGHHDYRE